MPPIRDRPVGQWGCHALQVRNMTFGLEMAALLGLPFAAAMGLSAGFAALDAATGRGLGGWLTVLLVIAMIPIVFFFLTATFETDFRTELFALAPLMAMLGAFVGYSLGRLARRRKAG
jgi:hypothetical protein